jgi:hypothetical protein
LHKERGGADLGAPCLLLGLRFSITTSRSGLKFLFLDLASSPAIAAIGAAIKFHSGKVVPSPRWASRVGLEWFWRLLHEPRTVWRRALVYGPQFMFLSLIDLFRHKTKPVD